MGFKSGIRSFLRDSYRTRELKRVYPDRYRKAAKKPVIPGSVVFLEVREKSMSDNFRLIRTALEKRNAASETAQPGMEKKHPHYTMSLVCIREGMENPVTVTKNCLSAISQIATAQFVFVSESSYFLSSLPIRPETTVIQTWHACGAFKKFGYSAVGKGFGTTREDLERFPVHGNFTYVTVSAPEVVWAYAEAFHMEERSDRILPIGVSRTDMFFSRKYRKRACEKIAWILRQSAPKLFPAGGDVYADRRQAEMGERGSEVIPGRKVLLYAPTFRGTVRDASSPDKLDIQLLKRKFGKDHILLINHHPFVKEKDRPAIPVQCRDFAFDLTGRVSIEELLTAADICITDYSSLVFEYALFERPLIFFAYDMEAYLDERGFYYPIREMMPGPVCRTNEDVIEAVGRAGAEFDLQRVRAFKYRFMSSCDGHATQRLLRLMDRCADEKQQI